MKRAILAILIWTFVVPVSAIAQGGDAALARALDHIAQSEWQAAQDVSAALGDVDQAIVAWHLLRAGQGEFHEYQRFLIEHSDWPGLKLLRRSGEASIGQQADPDAVITFFAPELPQTGTGSLRLAWALETLGATPVAADEVRRTWLGMSLTAEEQAEYLAQYGEILADFHASRLDLLLWNGRLTQAEFMLGLVGDDVRALGAARLALLRGDRGVDDLIEAVPAHLREDAGLAHARFKWRLRAGRRAAAVDLMMEHSSRPAGLGKPQYWSTDRLNLSRLILSDGNPGRAYLAAVSHGLQSGGNYAQLEWLAGYIALTRLDEPATALAHFQRFRVAVDTPISLGRAGYWEGRAQEALGRRDAALHAFEFAAEYQTSFYGQLAAIAAELPMAAQLAGRETYPDLGGTPLRESSVLAAANASIKAGRPELYRRFMRHLAESGTLPEQGMLGDLALEKDQPYTALYIAKYAAQSGQLLPRPYFPTPDGLLGELPGDHALNLAVVRRESEFDPLAQSRAGARGLMQLMPGTGDLMAKELGLEIETSDLTADPELNLRLGAGYLERLVDEFNGYLPAVAAGYNAGPRRAEDWLRELPSPFGSVEAAVDWIEAIPFAETRNYVMRVLEAREVYRARLAGNAVDWELDKVLVERQVN